MNVVVEVLGASEGKMGKHFKFNKIHFSLSSKRQSSLTSKKGFFRGTSILGEMHNVEMSGFTQQLLCSKSHDFLAVFALAHSKINQIA